MSNRPLLIIFAGLIATILVLASYLYRPMPGTNILLLAEEYKNQLLCQLQGNDWTPCLGFEPPCGCEEVYKDAGRACIGSGNCQSRVCLINNEDVPEEFGYVGRCARKVSDFGCGKAMIENRVVIKDLRGCVY